MFIRINLIVKKKRGKKIKKGKPKIHIYICDDLRIWMHAHHPNHFSDEESPSSHTSCTLSLRALGPRGGCWRPWHGNGGGWRQQQTSSDSKRSLCRGRVLGHRWRQRTCKRIRSNTGHLSATSLVWTPCSLFPRCSPSFPWNRLHISLLIPSSSLCHLGVLHPQQPGDKNTDRQQG